MDFILSLSQYFEYFPNKLSCYNAGFIINNGNYKFLGRNNITQLGIQYFNLQNNAELQSNIFNKQNVIIDIDKSNNKLLRCSKVNNLERKDRVRINSRLEDCRLFRFDNKIYTHGTSNSIFENGKLNIKTFVGILQDNSILEIPLAGDYDKFESPQKNWTPIVYNNDLYFEQNVTNPRRILKLEGKNITETHVDNFNYGVRFRGNCQNIDMNGEYLSFYHFHKGKDRSGNRNYYQVAAILDGKPPFKIKKISKPFRFPFGDSGIQFMSGVDILSNDVYISYGVADADNFLIKTKLNDIFKKFEKI